MSTRRSSIDDVARAAGVAIKTVSRVLNNEPNVREETSAKVLAAVKRLNYHPSLSARSLASRRSYLVGLVYENPSANYTIEVQRGALARCREGKFLLYLGTTGTGAGEFWLPNGIAISGKNEIFVTDSYNQRVQVFQYVGKE